ncbi:MAG TPA: hypothetical protein VLD59_13715 [Steroidobacteraceae bacterium]|nr:hypothetical protein [Steroidobacteraceae bacterium]
MNTNNDVEETGIRRIRREILEATGDEAPQVVRISGFESAEGVYRAVTSLRDLLTADAQQQLAVCFEWAREGIARQGDTAPELDALQAAYAYARDVMLEAATHSAQR